MTGGQHVNWNPTVLYAKLPTMIRSLHISGYRVFRDFNVPKLGRLNLFVGENNTGKTCLLEAVGLYAGRNPVNDFVEAATRRVSGRVRPWMPEGMNEESSTLRHPVFDLFHRSGPSQFSPRITIEKIGGDATPLRVEFRLHQRISDDQGLTRYVPLSHGDVATEASEIALPVYRGDRQVGLITRRSLPLRSRVAESERLFNEDAISVAHLPAGGFSEEKAASLWDALVQGPGQELVIDWLRMLDARIEDLAYVGDEGYQRTRIALLKIHGEGRIPMRSMGDGLTRLFHIGLATASAARGVVLIDEFENGLHWAVQEKLWGALARVAEDSNVQIFSTTHSRDCISGFFAGANYAERDATVYRLERRGSEIFALNLPLINVEAALREAEEFR